LLVFKSVLVLILTYGHERWVMTERILSKVEAAEMRFLRRVHSVTLRDKVLSCEVLKTLNVEPLLQVESYVWLSATMIWLFDQNVPGEIGARHVLLATPKGTRPIGRPRTRVAWLHLRPCLVQTWDNRNRQSYSTTTDHPLCNCNRL